MGKISLNDAAANYISKKKIGDIFTIDEIRNYIKKHSDTEAKDGSIRRGISHFKTGGVLAETGTLGAYKVAMSGTAKHFSTLASNSAKYRSKFVHKDKVEEAIMKRDRGCIYCGDLMNLVDHINATKVSEITMENLEDGAGCCQRCNNDKKDLTPAQFLIKSWSQRVDSFKKTGNKELIEIARIMKKCIKLCEKEMKI